MESFGSLMARRHVDFKRVRSAACPPASSHTAAMSLPS
jgi:hypothetical protein